MLGLAQLIGKNVPLRQAAQVRFAQRDATEDKESAGFLVTLDGRKLKTPKGQLLSVPTRGLAAAIATEWNYQQEHIHNYTMPLMTLTCTVLDQVPAQRETEIIPDLLRFLETDTVCVRVDEPKALADEMSSKWDPIVNWMNSRYSVRLGTTTGFTAAPHSPETQRTILKHLEGLDNWEIGALDALTSATKSLSISLAIIERHITTEQAVEACRLEEIFQAKQWGEAEGDFDVAQYDAKVKVGSANMLLRLLRPHKQ